MNKVLVANRSEIACRIFQACRELGIPTVGIMAPGDEFARHITYADEVECVESYLDISSVIQAALRAQANLIHPGYGFLSERSAFVEAVEKAGLVFIGPRAETMRMMGTKIEAKEIAARAQVPTLPWARVKPGEDLKIAAQKVGYPLLLKASAGGGGKGMRRVQSEQDLLAAAESATAEAKAAFGDGTLFLEKLMEDARHIEVQAFGDGKGGGIHLFERDCSLQRRHQKVWEEAPAIQLADETRQGLYQSALNLVKTTAYRNAGTLEFLVDQEGNYFFLEMNTRLQVEHPVTEMITGVDLVRAQILQAIEPDQFYFQQTPFVRGHSIEVRLYAEDPAQGFMPTPGRIEKLRWPTGTGIRVESGIEEGQLIGTQFDSMLGKLIVWAEDRDRALRRLRFALEETVMLGVGTNQSYLYALAQHPEINQRPVSTAFLEKEFTSFLSVPSSDELAIVIAAKKAGIATGAASREEAKAFASPWFYRPKGA